jgi:hypothetical protein
MSARKGWLRFWAILVLLGSASAPIRAADDLTLWTYSNDLYFDTSPTGANVAGAVRDFPVLVRLGADNFNFSQAMGRGQDIRFAKPSGQEILFEIERWDSAGRAAEIWLRIDTVPGNHQGVFARMHWGKPGSIGKSNPNGVFNLANDFESVWHLGGAAYAPRPNSVAGKPAAAPINYDGDETREGAVGPADSLDGISTGDHLQIGEGYTQFNPDFTFSVWAFPTRKSKWGRLFELANGAAQDNIGFGRKDTTQDLVLHIFQSGQLAASMTAPGVLYSNQWSLFTLTVYGRAGKIYRNGVLVASETLSAGITETHRTSNYLGRSNFSSDESFAGKLDEARFSDVARSADWIKLSYANQKAGQNLVWFDPPPTFCPTQTFGVPADTTLPEGSSLEMTGIADCAASYNWTALSGPAPRILDPEVKILQVTLPRVAKDTSILYRFTAVYGTSAKTKDVLIRIKETIPDPVFTLSGMSWNGKDSVMLKPSISNMTEIRNCREPTLFYTWTLANLPADTLWRKDGLLLRKAATEGVLKVGLCLHNNGAQTCKTANVTVQYTTALEGPETVSGAGMEKPGPKPGRDAKGRWVRPVRSRRAFPEGPAF